jgi:hypothetical protein
MTPADEGKLLAELWGVLTETQQCDISRRGAAMKAVLLRYEELGAPMRKPLGVSIATEYPGIALWAGLDGEAFSGHCEQKWERATNGVDLSRYPKYPHIGGVAGFNRGEPVK